MAYVLTKPSKQRRTSGAPRKRTATGLRRTAFHEAGHVIMARWLGLPMRRVTIKPDGDSLGKTVNRMTIPRWLRDDAEGGITAASAMWLEKQVRCFLAGEIAEAIATGQHNSAGARSDHRQAIECALLRCGSKAQAEAWLKWLSISTKERLNLLWSSVSLIADLLIEQETISEAQITSALREEHAHVKV